MGQAAVQEGVRKQLERSGIVEQVGQEAFFDHWGEVKAAYLQTTGEPAR